MRRGAGRHTRATQPRPMGNRCRSQSAGAEGKYARENSAERGSMKGRHIHPLTTWFLALLLLVAVTPAHAQTTPAPTTAPRETLQPTDAPTATPSSIPTDAPTAPATLAPTTPPAQATEAPTSTPETPTAIATSAPPSDTPQPVPLQVG